MSKFTKIYENPQNGYREEVCWPAAFVLTLFFAPIYFAIKGAWGAAVGCVVVTFGTAGAGYFIFPFFASKILHASYMRRGWTHVA